MAVPKKKTSQARRNQRRAHQALKSPHLGSCPNCGELRLSHRVCPKCGNYKGRTVIAVQASE
jgi:large subunit ribosomal protein L32